MPGVVGKINRAISLEAKTNYSLVGLAVILLFAVLIIAIIWLSAGFQRITYHPYLIYVDEAVAGLSSEAAVKYNGVTVGYVDNIKLNPRNPQQVVLLVQIAENVPITISTRATLVLQGITGNAYIGLSAKNPSLEKLLALPPAKYPVIPWTTSLFVQVESLLKDVAVDVKKVSGEIDRIFGEENTRNLNLILQNIAQSSRELPAITRSLNKDLLKFSTMVDTVTNAGISVSGVMKAGKLAVNKISYQAVTPFEEVLQKLSRIANNLEITTRDIRRNPTIIFRGVAPVYPAGPGERNT